VGLVPQLGAGAVEGHDPQVVRIKDSEVAGDLVVECHGWPRGVQQQLHHQLQVPWMTNGLCNLGCMSRDGRFSGKTTSWSTPAHTKPWLAL
jgi:hypothetical protein